MFEIQVSITLIATGFKRQDELDGRASKVILVKVNMITFSLQIHIILVQNSATINNILFLL